MVEDEQVGVQRKGLDADFGNLSLSNDIFGIGLLTPLDDGFHHRDPGRGGQRLKL